MLKEEEYFDAVRGAPRAEEGGGTRATYTERELPAQALLERALDAAARAAHAAPDVRARAARHVERAAREAVAAVRPPRAVRGATPLAWAPLPPHTASIRYLVTPARLRMIVRIGGREWSRDSPMASVRLNAVAFELREALRAPDRDARRPARELYDVLVAPVDDLLRAHGVRRLHVITDGVLGYVPLAALHDGRDPLVARYSLVEVTPAAPAPSAGVKSVVPARIAGLGVSRALAGFDPLVRVPTELERIVRRGPHDRDGVLPGIVLLDDAFTADALARVWRERYPFVHVATHFVFSPGPLADSYLLLGDGERWSLDELRRSGAALGDVDLLTLSACETAVTRADGTGRERESFAVLAQRQGARHVLATLWRVSDLSSATFMARFYAAHRAGRDLPDALRDAQLGFARARGGPWRHPYYWAPYTLMTSAR
jgi:CHAT domain-containing protein